MAGARRARALCILEAVSLTASGNLSALEQLLSSRPLTTDHVLRIILTYLPKGTSPESYVGLIKTLAAKRDAPCRTPETTLIPNEGDIPIEEALARVRRLSLLPLRAPQSLSEGADSVSHFLIHQTYLIETDTGSFQLAAQLLQHFVDHSQSLRIWMISTLLPLLRLEYAQQGECAQRLEDFERMESRTAIDFLLAQGSRSDDEVDNAEAGSLRTLVGAYLYTEHPFKRRKASHVYSKHEDDSKSWDRISSEKSTRGWGYVNQRLLDRSRDGDSQSISTFMSWGGPSDVDYGDWARKNPSQTQDDGQAATLRYAQAGLAVLYDSKDSSPHGLMQAHELLKRLANLAGIGEPVDFGRADLFVGAAPLSALSRDVSVHALSDEHLLEEDNCLTRPSALSITLLNLLIASSSKLLGMGRSKSLKDIAVLCCFGTSDQQEAEHGALLQLLKGEKKEPRFWFKLREDLLWLRSWGDTSYGAFAKLPLVHFETELLRAMLQSGSYIAAVEIYCRNPEPPLARKAVEECVITAAYSAYDSATNGNRKRGSMRKTSELVGQFRGVFPASTGLAEIEALVSAAHSMSFYSLALHSGVPFIPVNIRSAKDPISLVGRVLEQNPQAYTKLDDLLVIGQNLVKAGLYSKEYEVSTEGVQDHIAKETHARRRTTRMAIEAALTQNDFDTAYSYIVTRLHQNDERDRSRGDNDDESWRAAYAAGRFPANSSGSSTSRRLEQRMELLSQALLIAPAGALTEILQAWQHCEDDLTKFSANEAADADAWSATEDQRVPGGFEASSVPLKLQPASNRPMLEEEAPMGLFEVARGAASALSKNAFPLRGSTGLAKGPPGERAAMGAVSTEDEVDADDGSTRVRKRDMVSNMVTGGLVSGIGWVIGEPPELIASLRFKADSQFYRSARRTSGVRASALDMLDCKVRIRLHRPL